MNKKIRISKANNNCYACYARRYRFLKKESGHVVVILSPSNSNFRSVGQYYQEFNPVADEDIIEIAKATSLGSFISKSIIKAHYGRIWVESNYSKGRNGATFRFSFPFSNNNNAKKMRIMIMITVKKIEVIIKLLNRLGEIND